MATEASKTKAIYGKEFLPFLTGDGIDIGCGVDPILPNVDCFDLLQGDANFISRFVHKKYDFVFSSHTLEHMAEPYLAIQEWFSLLKPGGYLIVTVPDEDLYEQGAFPSIFNGDHKFTFTLSKAKSWSDRSINVLELVRTLDGDVMSLSLQDYGYDRSMMSNKPGRLAIKFGRLAMKLAKKLPSQELRILKFFSYIRAAIDQTNMHVTRLAQIQFVIRKKY